MYGWTDIRRPGGSFYWLLIEVLILASLASEASAVDCRKFIYAPVCRGVAAKRAYHHPEPADSQHAILFDLESSKAVPEELTELFPTSGQINDAVNIRTGGEGDGTSDASSRSSTNNIMPELIPIIGHSFQIRPKDERQIKPVSIYDWYLKTRKRLREDLVYDY